MDGCKRWHAALTTDCAPSSQPGARQQDGSDFAAQQKEHLLSEIIIHLRLRGNLGRVKLVALGVSLAYCRVSAPCSADHMP